MASKWFLVKRVIPLKMVRSILNKRCEGSFSDFKRRNAAYLANREILNFLDLQLTH